MTVNEKEFGAAQEQSKLASKGTFRKDKADTLKLDVHDLAALEKNSAIPKTDDSAKFGAHVVADAIDRSADTLEKVLAPSMPGSRASSTIVNFSHQRLPSPKVLTLASFWTVQASMRKRVAKSTTPETSLSTVFVTSRSRMSRRTAGTSCILATSSMANSTSEMRLSHLTTSFGDGHCGATTRRHTFLTSLFGRFSVITSTKKDLSSHPQSFALTSHTRPKLLCPIYPGSRQ